MPLIGWLLIGGQRHEPFVLDIDARSTTSIIATFDRADYSPLQQRPYPSISASLATWSGPETFAEHVG